MKSRVNHVSLEKKLTNENTAIDEYRYIDVLSIFRYMNNIVKTDRKKVDDRNESVAIKSFKIYQFLSQVIIALYFS